MKYLVTVSLAVICFAGLCRWIAQGVAHQFISPDPERRRHSRTPVSNGNRTNMPAAAPITPKHNAFSGMLNDGSHR